MYAHVLRSMPHYGMVASPIGMGVTIGRKGPDWAKPSLGKDSRYAISL